MVISQQAKTATNLMSTVKKYVVSLLSLCSDSSKEIMCGLNDTNMDYASCFDQQSLPWENQFPLPQPSCSSSNNTKPVQDSFVSRTKHSERGGEYVLKRDNNALAQVLTLQEQ